jgi:hypothetical protein
MIEDIHIKLSAFWIAVMLTYLLGDVIRIFSGDFTAGEMEGQKATQMMYLGIAVMMMIPIVMVLLSIYLKQPVNRWTNIIVAAIFFIFNLVGLPSYPGMYDKFLLAVSLVFNLLTIWTAWRWI